MGLYPIKRALLSVSDKSGVVELARTLLKYNIEIISSGGTRKVLEENGISVTPIENVTGNPEAFDGRMKTLSFQVMSGLLYRRDHPNDLKQAEELSISAIDLVVCHLYPFEKVMNANAPLAELIENIDIGGPTMLRSAAKNYTSVVVCPDPSFYPMLTEQLDSLSGQTELSFRKEMALRTLRHTAHYDSMITSELERRFDSEDRSFFLSTSNATKLRYGENPHQMGFVVKDDFKGELLLAGAKPLQGKELSYNNLWDADQAYRCARDLSFKFPHSFSTVIVKHANPCGLSVSKDGLSSLKNAWSCDPVSSFGSIIAFSHEVGESLAAWLEDKFVELIIAPGFTQEALDLFSKKKNLRVLKCDFFIPKHEMMARRIHGGWIMQAEDGLPAAEFDWVSEKKPTQDNQALLVFGLIAGKHLRSNAIALVQEIENDFLLVGAGMGNPNRLVSVKQAFEKADESGFKQRSEMVLISDAFFPFDDNIVLAHEYGVQTIVQPGGSIKDKEVIATVDKLGMSMAFTGRRNFRH